MYLFPVIVDVITVLIVTVVILVVVTVSCCHRSMSLFVTLSLLPAELSLLLTNDVVFSIVVVVIVIIIIVNVMIVFVIVVNVADISCHFFISIVTVVVFTAVVFAVLVVLPMSLHNHVNCHNVIATINLYLSYQWPGAAVSIAVMTTSSVDENNKDNDDNDLMVITVLMAMCPMTMMISSKNVD